MHAITGTGAAHRCAGIHKEHIPCIDGYNMITDQFPEDYSKPIYEQVKMGRRDNSFDKKIVFNPNMVLEINYGPGAHSCQPKLKSSGTVDPYSLNLLHMKYMGREYVKQKHLQYASRLSHENKKFKWGAEYLDPGFVDRAFALFEGDHRPVAVVP